MERDEVNRISRVERRARRSTTAGSETRLRSSAPRSTRLAHPPALPLRTGSCSSQGNIGQALTSFASMLNRGSAAISRGNTLLPDDDELPPAVFHRRSTTAEEGIRVRHAKSLAQDLVHVFDQ